MAQEYNIYLRKRLTEFDVIIKNLPYRDGLIMYNKMYLDAMVNYLCLQRFIIGESDADLRTEIDELLERVFNTFQSKVEIDLDVELAAGKPISGQSDLVFATNPFEMGEETYEVFQNLTRLTTSALQYDLAKSIGSGHSDLIFHTSTADTLKTAFDKMQNNVELLLSSDTDKETFAGAGTEMQLNTDRFDLYYLLAVQGEAVMNLLCSMDFEMWYTLGNANQTFYLTAVNNGVKSTKYLSADGFMSLIAAVNESLEAFIKTEFSELHLTPNVVAGLKRYRLLSDLDSSTLSSIDSVSLDELDYVELA